MPKFSARHCERGPETEQNNPVITCLFEIASAPFDMPGVPRNDFLTDTFSLTALLITGS